MKKKLMMVAVLLGALSLGACVDNDESASVEAVRNAKAEQLKGAAALANAQAGVQDAQKRLAEAQAEAKEFENQKDQEDYERNKEKLIAQANADLWAAKANEERAKQDFLNVADEQLKQLYSEYQIYSSQLNGLQETRDQNAVALANYKAGLISYKEVVEKQKAIKLASIAQNDAKIAAYTKYDGLDKADLQNKVVEALQVKNNTIKATTAAAQAKIPARNAYQDVIADFTSDESSLKTVVAARTIIDRLLNFGVNAPIEGCEYDYIDNTGVYYYSGMLSVGNGEYIQPIETSSKEIAENLFVTYYSWESEYAKEEATQSFNNQYAAAVKLLGKSDDKADAGTKYAALTAANEELKAAGEDQAKIDVANISIAKAKDAIKEQNKVIADLKEMTELIASMSGADVAAYDKAIEALKTNETVLAYVAACDAYDDAYEAYEVADANYSALFNLANNYGVDAKAHLLERFLSVKVFPLLIIAVEFFLAQLIEILHNRIIGGLQLAIVGAVSNPKSSVELRKQDFNGVDLTVTEILICSEKVFEIGNVL